MFITKRVGSSRDAIVTRRCSYSLQSKGMQNTECVVILHMISVSVSSILARLSHEVYVVILDGF